MVVAPLDLHCIGAPSTLVGATIHTTTRNNVDTDYLICGGTGYGGTIQDPPHLLLFFW